MACRSPLRPRSAVTAEWGAKASTGDTRRQIGPFAGSGPSIVRVPTTSRRRGRDVIASRIRVTDTSDVAVIGAGVAGLTSAVFLRRAGLRVVCVDTRAYPHHKVGESLDWSSPNMLQRVGIGRESLIDDRIATYKKGIAVCEPGRPDWDVQPPPSITRSPLRFETLTLHVDRTALDQRLYVEALALGTTFVWERVTDVDVDGDRVRGCVTTSGRRIEARHYIDASGTALVFARAMGIPTREYGRTKVCLWTYFKTPPLQRATTFFLDSRDDYLSWIWDIPITPTETSVGFITTADAIRSERRAGRSVEAILATELSRHKRFDALLAEQPVVDVKTTSFRPYVTTRVAGPNWFMAGEAASMPDPLTGNGLTSGIRHAQWATDAILAAGSAARSHLAAAVTTAGTCFGSAARSTRISRAPSTTTLCAGRSGCRTRRSFTRRSRSS